jgi:hypothetical protein
MTNTACPLPAGEKSTLKKPIAVVSTTSADSFSNMIEFSPDHNILVRVSTGITAYAFLYARKPFVMGGEGPPRASFPLKLN